MEEIYFFSNASTRTSERRNWQTPTLPYRWIHLLSAKREMLILLFHYIGRWMRYNTTSCSKYPLCTSYPHVKCLYVCMCVRCVCVCVCLSLCVCTVWWKQSLDIKRLTLFIWQRQLNEYALVSTNEEWYISLLSQGRVALAERPWTEVGDSSQFLQ